MDTHPSAPIPSTPATTNPAQLLTHPDVIGAIRGSLLSRGVREQDLQDSIHDVYVKALASFQRSPPPPDVERMMALCAKIARDLAVDRLRKADQRRRDLNGKCHPDRYVPLDYGYERRDPIDAGRQLEVLAQLFREGAMPAGGVDILEGVASRCSHAEIAQDLGITVDLVMWRLRTMRKVFRARMTKLCMLPGMLPLRLIVSEPAAIPMLRQAA
jgi:DNA-directed RNA polymerase specialized sigma24 family protein